MARQPSAPRAKELFRYARVHPPRILDLQSRLAAHRDVGPLVLDASSDPKTRSSKGRTWASQFAKSKDYVGDIRDIGLPIFEWLTIEDVPEDRLPCRDCVQDRQKLEAFVCQKAKTLEQAKLRIALSVFASVLLGDKDAAARLSRTLQFLELLPDLSKTERRAFYAPAVLRRYKNVPLKERSPSVDEKVAKPEDEETASTLSQATSDNILKIWDLSNEYGRWKKRSLEAKIDQIKNRTFAFQLPKPTGKSNQAIPAKKIKAARKKQYSAYITEKRDELKALNTDLKSVAEQAVRERIAAAKDDADFQAYIDKKYGKDVSELLEKTSVPEMAMDGFCELYVKKKSWETDSRDQARRCLSRSGNPCVEEFSRDRHEVRGEDDVRPLGLAELITVEENWLTYLPGEISAIENILKGELRKKEVKSTKYFEEFAERITQDSTDVEVESQSKVKQDLGSQIESEIATRFESDINTSASGSGGGTIGVVALEGGASLAAGIGLGLDTRFSSSNESNFSQEIVSKAVERTKKATSEIRRSRTYQLFETTNYHEINNTGNGAAHTSVIFCYLDKKICITERVYGIRKFLNAEIIWPGRDLVENETRKHLLNLNDIGPPPTFDLSPNDITPENYLDLVGRLRATNVSPPPPYVKVVSKTYKTDITNENRELNEINFKKIADVLTPFFGQYKHFLIQDNIEIPEGYQVQEVRVTVTHGSNGVSIPAHQPFSLLGAVIYAMPTIGVAAVPPYALFYLPIAIWQVLYAASPFLHYNADSSNVTVNVGHQTEESPYFFFQPDFLIREIIDALGNFSVLTENFIQFIQDKLQALYTAFTSTMDNGVIIALTDMSDEMRDAINTFINELQKWLGDLVTNVIPSMITGGSGSEPTLPQIPSLDASVIAAIPAAIMAPFKTFFDEIVAHLEDLMQGALGDIFEYFISMTDNTDTKVFSGAKRFTDALPVSFNCIALKPSVTINLSVCMVRIDDLALDAWRLETFDRLNQGYYQLEADYDGRRQAKVMRPAHRDSPDLMREEEREVIKNRTIRALHRKYSNAADLAPSLDELQLFEHAIDWENVSFRLFGYGPSGLQVAYEKLGLFDAADERRKRFMDALWSHVLIPLREDKRLEQVMIRFMETGIIDFESNLLAELDGEEGEPLNELTEIYRDLILQRQQLPEVEPVHRQEIIPTELIVIYEPHDDEFYPVNPISCGDGA